MNNTNRIAYLQGFYQAYGMNKEAQNYPMGITLEDFNGNPPGRDWDLGNLTEEQSKSRDTWSDRARSLTAPIISPEEIARRNQNLDAASIAADAYEEAGIGGVPYARQFLRNNKRPPEVYKKPHPVSSFLSDPVDVLFNKGREAKQKEKDRISGEFQRAVGAGDTETVDKYMQVPEVRDQVFPPLNKQVRDAHDAATAQNISRWRNFAIGAGTTAAIGIPLAMLMSAGNKSTTADPRIAGLRNLLSSTKDKDDKSIDYDSEGNVIIDKMKAFRLEPSKEKSVSSRIPSAILKSLTDTIENSAKQKNKK
jgi:hypothetical protein